MFCAGITPTPNVPRATRPPSLNNPMLVGIEDGEVAGRGLPPVPAPGVSTKLPERPPPSRQVPLRVLSAMSASTGTARPPGVDTIFRPKPMLPSGFWKAVPITEF